MSPEPNPSAASRASRSDPVGDLLVRCMEQLASGDHGAIEELCRAHPEHTQEIRERMGVLLQMGLVEGITADADSFPERLGEFQLVRRLGGGGMGVVYEALQEKLGRTVALKLIRPEHLYFPRARERFRRETEAVARLQHPGIVSIYTVGEERGIPYFAMELVRGATLADVLTTVETRAPDSLRGEDLREAVLGGAGFEAFTENDATRELFEASWTEACVRIVHHIAEALAHAHARGVLHRDIKPSNIAITPEGRVVLLDFGLASASVDVRMTTYGTAVGSVLYMAPEQIEGKLDEIDGRTDVYALGVTLYELLSLQVPYSGKTAEEVRGAIRDNAAPPPRVRNHRVSRDLETVCMKAIDGERSRRYATMQAFAADLHRVLVGEPVEARPPGRVARAARWVSRNPTTTMASVLGFVLLVGVPSLLYVQQREYGAQLERALDAETAALEQANLARIAADRERERAQIEARDSETVARFLAEIFASADPDRERGRPPTAEALLHRGVARIELELADQPELRARLEERMAESFQGLGLFEDALPLAERALVLRRQLHESDDVRVADALRLVGTLRRLAGRTDQGNPQLLEAREIYTCANGPRDRRALLAEIQIAKAWITFGGVEAGLGLLYHAWAAELESDEPDPELRVAILDGLAHAARTGQRTQLAWAPLALLELRTQMGQGDVERSQMLENFAYVLPIADREQKLALHEEATEVARAAYGDQSPRYSQHLAFLGSLRKGLGQHEVALANCVEAERILDSTLGPEHPQTLFAVQNAATLELLLGRGPAALERLRASAAAVLTRLGPKHPRPRYMEWRVAQTAMMIGRPDEALEPMEHVLALDSFVGIDRESLRNRALATLAWARLDLGDVAGAERELASLGKGIDEPGAEFAVLAEVELAFERREPSKAIATLERTLQRPDSRLYEDWRRPVLNAALEFARMTADPASATRPRLEQALGGIATAFGRASVLSRRYYSRALKLLETVEPLPRDG